MPHHLPHSVFPAPSLARRTVVLAGAALAVGLLGGLAGCRGDRTDAPPRQFFPDMDDQPKWDPQEVTDLYLDGRTQRQPPVGAVAFGRSDMNVAAYGDQPWAEGYERDRATLLGESDEIFRGITGGSIDGADLTKAQWVERIPIEVTPELVEHGEERFNIYCAVCHGYTGDGKGPVGLKWSYLPANLTAATYTDRSATQGKDGYLFHIAMNGLGEGDNRTKRMPGYRHALSAYDGWAVIAYVRALQTAANGSINDITDPAERARLESARLIPSSATPAPAPAAPSGAPADEAPANDAAPQEGQPQTNENGGAS